ncbi:MAG TPA: hypothetical protein PKX92_13335 [Edaphocola sp.]|nr:hypothetical protein [Edaphocola sp.]
MESNQKKENKERKQNFFKEYKIDILTIFILVVVLILFFFKWFYSCNIYYFYGGIVISTPLIVMSLLFIIPKVYKFIKKPIIYFTKSLHKQVRDLLNYILGIIGITLIIGLITRLNLEPKGVSLVVFLPIILLILFLSIAWYIAGKKIKSAIAYNIRWKYILHDLWIPIIIAVIMTIIIDWFQNQQLSTIANNICTSGGQELSDNTLCLIWKVIFNFFSNLLVSLLTYVIVLYSKVKNHIKSIDDNKHWKEYVEKIKEYKNEVKALSIVDLDDFFEPIGLRYLIEQIAYIKCCKKLKRLIVLKDNVEFSECWGQEITRSSNKWTQQERMLYNFVKLCGLRQNVDLYITTTYEINKFLEEENIQVNHKDLDRLIIDDTMYHPRWEDPYKKNKLIFDQDNDSVLKGNIEKIISKFCITDYQITIP